MQLTDEDIDDIIPELLPFIEQLAITSKPREELVLAHAEAMPYSATGSLDEILNHLRHSLKLENKGLDIPDGWEPELGIADENSQRGYLELFWGLRLKGAGSMSREWAIIRRGPDCYEILYPVMD